MRKYPSLKYPNDEESADVFTTGDIVIQEKLDGGALTFFGEAMTPHTLEYDRSSTPMFVGFDVYHEDDGRWLTQAEIERAFDTLDLPTTPVIDIVSAEFVG